MYLTLIMKTVILYIFVIIVYRIMGKKEVGELGVSDLIVTVLIAELAALTIEETDKSIFVSIIPILVLIFSEIIISYIELKSGKARRFIDGHPSVIIKNGKIKFSTMTHLRYSLDDLILGLRSKGIKSIEEVDYAILETTGELSVFQNTKVYPLPIILDGKIDYHTLSEIEKDYEWVKNMLDKQNLNLKDVFYAFYNKNKTYIIRKKDLI